MQIVGIFINTLHNVAIRQQNNTINECMFKYLLLMVVFDCFKLPSLEMLIRFLHSIINIDDVIINVIQSQHIAMTCWLNLLFDIFHDVDEVDFSLKVKKTVPEKVRQLFISGTYMVKIIN